MAQTMTQTHGTSGPMHSLQHHDAIPNGSSMSLYSSESPQQSEELYKRSVMLVIWYKSSWVDAYNHATGQWEQHMIDTVRLVQSEQRILYRLRRSLLEGLTEDECPDIDNEVAMQPPPMDHRHPHRIANANSGGSGGRKRPAPDSGSDPTGPASKFFIGDYQSGHGGPQSQPQQQYAVPVAQNYSQTLSTQQQSHSSPIQAHNGIPQGSSTLSSPSSHGQTLQQQQQPPTTLKQGSYAFQQGGMFAAPPPAGINNAPSSAANNTTATAPSNLTISPQQSHSQSNQLPRHHQQSHQQHQPQHEQHPSTQSHLTDLPDHLRNPIPAPAPIPYHPHPPLKRWPNDYTVSEISLGFKQMDALIASMPTLTQRVAFEKVFGCRYVKSTVCRHRGVWRRAGDEVRGYFEGLGRDERAVWGEFVRKVEGRASGLQGGGENGGAGGGLDGSGTSSGVGSNGAPRGGTGIMSNGHGVVGQGVGVGGMSVGIPLGQTAEDMVHMQGAMMVQHGHNHNHNHGHGHGHGDHLHRPEPEEEGPPMGSLGPPPPGLGSRMDGTGAQNGELPTQTHTPLSQQGGTNPHVPVYDPSLTNALGGND